ncbi:hypothetical protein CN977_21455 [Bacillus thuringiensis]|uniref:hypothetical protein n=1 Tax=Bacillus thuringiensis TaxID=1428 RepID=UPI000BFE2CA4|nr:hypothetical protein [Bacillus thuringiensis]PGO43048.1 hypothetical protein CN977_21455 [Bacillus thuringiensis]
MAFLRIFLLIIKMLDDALLKFDEWENELNESENKFKKKLGIYAIDLMALLLFSYFFGALLYVFITFLPSFNSIIESFVKNLGYIFTGEREFLSPSLLIIPSLYISFKDIFLWLVLIAFIAAIIVYLNKDNNEFRMVKILAISNSILRLVVKNLKIEKSLVIIGLIFIFVTLFITYAMVPDTFFVAHILEILFFWTAIFVILITYSNFNKDSIRAKRFVVFIVFIPIVISNILQNKTQGSISLLFLTVTIFLTFERVFAILVEYKEQIYEGKEWIFALRNLEQKDYDKIRTKHNLDNDDYLEIFEDKVLAGMVFYKGTKRDLLKSKVCFESSLVDNPDDTFCKYLLAQVLVDIGEEQNIQKSINLFQEIKKQQQENPYVFEVKDVEEYIAYLEFISENPKYNEIINILKDKRNLQNDFVYILGVSYLYVEDLKKARETLDLLEGKEDKLSFNDWHECMAYLETKEKELNQENN